jgi:hypothetical protein
MKHLITTTLLASTFLSAAVGAAEPAPTQAEVTEPKPYPLSLGAEIGTTGIGGTAAWRFSEHLGLRGGAHYVDYSDDGLEVEDITYGGSILLQNQELGLDIFPWKNRSFRITLGAFFNQNELEGTATGSVEIEGNTYTVSAADPVRLQIESDPVNPFVSVGGNLFYFDKAHRWAFFGEVGVVYTGEPEVRLTGPAIIPSNDLESERQEIEDALSDFPFWPVAKIGISFSF